MTIIWNLKSINPRYRFQHILGNQYVRPYNQLTKPSFTSKNIPSTTFVSIRPARTKLLFQSRNWSLCIKNIYFDFYHLTQKHQNWIIYAFNFKQSNLPITSKPKQIRHQAFVLQVFAIKWQKSNHVLQVIDSQFSISSTFSMNSTKLYHLNIYFCLQ